MTLLIKMLFKSTNFSSTKHFKLFKILKSLTHPPILQFELLAGGSNIRLGAQNQPGKGTNLAH